MMLEEDLVACLTTKAARVATTQPYTWHPLPPTHTPSKLTQFNPSTENSADNMCRMWWLLLI